MSPPVDVASEAQGHALAAAAQAGLVVRGAHAVEELREVSDLFRSVWGATSEGAPITSEVMRSLVHADGLVSVARAEQGGALWGAAVLARAGQASCYSIIAATRPGLSDRGIGFALKQHQRAWALGAGLATMRWTFDPLVSRNARFNLTRLGARARVYEQGFYGQMTDDVNSGDVSDRLVPEWQLGSEPALAAARGVAGEPGPPPPAAEGARGPDGDPAHVERGEVRWVRVPPDIVAMRREEPDLAAAWRLTTRPWFVAAFDGGYTAVGVSRDGWYRLEKEQL